MGVQERFRKCLLSNTARTCGECSSKTNNHSPSVTLTEGSRHASNVPLNKCIYTATRV